MIFAFSRVEEFDELREELERFARQSQQVVVGGGMRAEMIQKERVERYLVVAQVAHGE